MTKPREEQAACAEIYFKSVVETVREPLLILDEQMRVISANRAFYRLFHVSPEETERKHVYELGSGQWKLDGLRDLLEKVIPSNEQFQDYEVDYNFPILGHRVMLLNGRRIDQGEGHEQLILLAIEDITEQKRKDNVLAATLTLVDNSPDVVTRYDREGHYLYVNKALERHIGKSKEEIIGKTLPEAGVPPETTAVLQAAFGRILKTIKREIIVVPLGGRIYQAFIEPETDQAGDIVSFAAYSRDITEIQRAEEKLRRSEEIIQGVSSVILTTDRQGNITFINDYGHTFFGYTRDELLGKQVAVMLMPKTDSAGRDTRALIEKIMANPDQHQSSVIENIKKSGERVWITWTNKAIRDERGNPSGIFAVGNDITAMKRAEEKLRESEEKYRTLVEHATEGIIIVQDGVIKYANSRMAELDGSAVGEIVGTSYTDHIYPGEIPKLAEMYRRRMAGEKVPSFYETILRRRDGKPAPAEVSAAIIVYQGRPADLVIIHDISQHKRTEEELRRKEEEFRSLADNSPDIVVRYDRNDRFLYANPKAEPIFRRRRTELIGKSSIELGMPRQGADFWESLVQEVFATKKEKTVEFEFPPGEKHFNAHLVPEFDDKGNVLSVLSISRDITGMKKKEAILRRNEYELRTLVDNSPDLIFRFNSAMRYEYVNSAYERLTGIPKERFIGKTNEELGMPRQLVEFWQQALVRVIESGQEYSMEFEMTSLFGKRYFTTRLMPEFIKSGRVETVLAIARDITDRMHAEEQLRYVSFHDKVTGLFNRAFFEEELRRIDTERELPISIIMGDVNNLKLTNDVFGHQEGDKLLKTIAESIRKACRNNDIVARWGGDEFAVILPKTDFATAEAVHSRINQIAGENKGTVMKPSIALGAAVKEKCDQNIYHIVRRAEQAMYDDKFVSSKQNEKIVISSLLAGARESTKDLTVHVERGNAVARRFGKELELDEDSVKNLLLLIELHDIGTVVIPQKILAKPGRLTEDEWELVKRHPEAGFRIVKSFPDTARISDEVLSHDEHWDGTGYPRGLKGKEIPFLARVFALIEAYDVMTHPRHYARTFTRDEAIEELRRNAGSQFDPELVEKFIACLSPAEKAGSIR